MNSNKKRQRRHDDDAPRHKYVNGELVELSDEEIEEILAERERARDQEQTNERSQSE